MRTLANRAESVVAIVRPEDEIPERFPAEVRALDAGDEEALAAALNDVSRVIHLAARSGGIQLQEATHRNLYVENRRLTDSVLGAAAAIGIDRVFIASSAVVYRDSASGTIDEDDPIVGPGDVGFLTVEKGSGYGIEEGYSEVCWFYDLDATPSMPEGPIAVNVFARLYDADAFFAACRRMRLEGAKRLEIARE